MATARMTDPTTSWEAAGSVRNITETQVNILLCLAVPRTDDELVDTFDLMAGSNGWKLASASGIRSRRAELVDRGLVKDTGERRKTWSGRNAIVWQAV
jgi:hypothetical protein